MEQINTQENLNEFDIKTEKVKKLEANGEKAYKAKFAKTHEIHDLEKIELGTKVSVAGRMIFKRTFGKLIFARLYAIGDNFDINFNEPIRTSVQISLSMQIVGEDALAKFKEFCDVGDFVGVHGELCRTQTGELTVQVEKFELLSKALRGLPEKFHGLTDTEARYRQRYLDIISNEKSRLAVLVRFKVTQFLREFYIKHGFLEVETPVLQNAVGGALAKPFHTHHNALDFDMNLRISPETYLKRTIACGFDKVFEIAKDFRNEGLCVDKLQEFTMLESYAAYWNFEDSINFYTELFREVCYFVFGKYEFMANGRNIVLPEKFPRLNYVETLNNILGFNVLEMTDVDEFKKLVKEKHLLDEAELDEQYTVGGITDLLYKRKMRPNIIEPTILYNYPNVVPLARYSDEDDRIIEMFQLVIDGQEMIKGYSELVNPIQQKRNFEEQANAKKRGDAEAMDYDKDYILAMEHGFPPISGIGFGIDIFIYHLLDCENIRDTILFPITKPIEQGAKEEKNED
ncbi:MAG: lysine--tRNA ligase [Clostridia bacterium]|nr:lysine--tRNA ligase [Clostridia bacterium]